MIGALWRKRSIWHNTAVRAALLLTALVVVAPALAEESQIGRVNAVSGTVSVIRGGDRAPAKLGQPIYQSDVIETGADGGVSITFIDASRFSLSSGSQLALQEFRFDTSNSHGSMMADLRQGSLAVVSGAITHTTPGAMRIKTPTSILSVRGTTFGVQVTGDKERYVVFPNAGGGSGAISIGTPAAGAGDRRLP